MDPRHPAPPHIWICTNPECLNYLGRVKPFYTCGQCGSLTTEYAPTDTPTPEGEIKEAIQGGDKNGENH